MESIHSKDLDNATGAGDLDGQHDLVTPATHTTPENEAFLDILVEAFLSWPMPDSVCSDRCVILRGYPNRVGTNLLTATEAKQMFRYVLEKAANKRNET
jgi:hypothetical protein